MGIRATLIRAAGAFILTAVLFTAAIVVAHSLAIPDPVGRILPVTRYEAPEPASEESSEGVALATDRGVSTPQRLEDVAQPEVTAVPTPPDDGDVASGDQADGATAGNDDGQDIALADDGADEPDADPEPAEPDPAPDDRAETADGSDTQGERSGATTSTPPPPPKPVSETPSTQTSSRVTDQSTDDHDDDDDRQSWWDYFGRDDDRDRDWDDRDRDWDDRDDDQQLWWDYFGRDDQHSWWDRR